LPENLYVHFPFCRRKCSYCALHSRAGVSVEARGAYVADLVRSVGGLVREQSGLRFKTVYFGGGSPALCDLRPLLEALAPLRDESAEFTVELHPLDVTVERLKTLRLGGVNRISMGVQSLDDAILADMGRGYTFAQAERAFGLVKEVFDNAGIDLIIGYPSVGDRPPSVGDRPLSVGDSPSKNGDSPLRRLERIRNWGLRHCSVYSLIIEEKSLLAHRLKMHPAERVRLPSDDETLDALKGMARFLDDLGLERYEISNYAVPGFECRHNQAVWRGEDYLGLGEGACGRVGLTRTESGRVIETVSPEADAKERRLFRLRTREGLNAGDCPQWIGSLDRFAAEGLLTKTDGTYRLTERGTEVCDSVLAELV